MHATRIERVGDQRYVVVCTCGFTSLEHREDLAELYAERHRRDASAQRAYFAQPGQAEWGC